jgi:hypothetical protein
LTTMTQLYEISYLAKSARSETEDPILKTEDVAMCCLFRTTLQFRGWW